MTEHSRGTADVEQRFSDEAYWGKVALEAHRIAWAGYKKRRIPDLPLRLQIVRTALKLRHEIWTDADIAHAMFGGDRGDNRSSIRFNKFKKGSTTLDEIEASLLACFINYALVDCPRSTRRLTMTELLDFSSWLLKGKGENGPVIAADITSNIVTFTRKIHTLAKQEAALDGLPSDPMGDGATHDWLMDVICSPVRLANWDHRLIVQNSRKQYPTPGQRFGKALKVGTDPRKWIPTEPTVGHPLEYVVATQLSSPAQGWFVTIRDPAPLINERRVSSEWVWNAGWENVIRWLPSPFELGPGSEIIIPVAGRNDLLDIPGLFRVFLLVEPIDSYRIAKTLSIGNGTAILDEVAYLRLIDSADQLAADSTVTVYTGSYQVT